MVASFLSDVGGEMPSARFGGLLLHLERVVLGLFFFLHEGLPPVTTEKRFCSRNTVSRSFLFSAKHVFHDQHRVVVDQSFREDASISARFLVAWSFLWWGRAS